jgi:hypothetical protein
MFNALIQHGAVQQHEGWIALLNTGELVFENAAYTGMAGELTSWQMLLTRCRADNVRIVGLALRRAGAWVIAMDNADSYFQARMATSVLNQTREEHFQGIGTVLEAQGLIQITWVSQFGVVYHDMQPLSAQWVHTSQRQLNDLYTP